MEDQKQCKQCNKIINFFDYKYKDTPYSTRWNKVKYCSPTCEKEYVKNNRRPYILKKTEYDENTNKINNILSDESYELQMTNKICTSRPKNDLGDEKKHVLIIAVPDVARKKFDEVYFFNGSGLVKITF